MSYFLFVVYEYNVLVAVAAFQQRQLNTEEFSKKINKGYMVFKSQKLNVEFMEGIYIIVPKHFTAISELPFAKCIKLINCFTCIVTAKSATLPYFIIPFAGLVVLVLCLYAH